MFMNLPARTCVDWALASFSVSSIVTAYGIGSPLIGKLSDLLGAATNPGVMRYGFLVSPISCLLAAIILHRGSRLLEKTHESA